MQKRKKNYGGMAIDAVSGGIDEACMRYGLGKTTMRKVAEDANAIIRIDRRLLINYMKVDTYMNAISQ